MQMTTSGHGNICLFYFFLFFTLVVILIISSLSSLVATGPKTYCRSLCHDIFMSERQSSGLLVGSFFISLKKVKSKLSQMKKCFQI